jgi:hypothetical protein
LAALTPLTSVTLCNTLFKRAVSGV